MATEIEQPPLLYDENRSPSGAERLRPKERPTNIRVEVSESNRRIRVRWNVGKVIAIAVTGVAVALGGWCYRGAWKDTEKRPFQTGEPRG